MTDNWKSGHYRIIPIHYNVDDGEIVGKNWLYDLLVDMAIWVDVNIIEVDSFPVWIDDD